MFQRVLIQSRNLAEGRKKEIIRLHYKLATPSYSFSDVLLASYSRVAYMLSSGTTITILIVSWFIKLSVVLTLSVMDGLDILLALIYFHISCLSAIFSGCISGFIAGVIYPILTRRLLFILLLLFPMSFGLTYFIDYFLMQIFGFEYLIFGLLQSAVGTIIFAFICACLAFNDGRWLNPASAMYLTNDAYKRLKAFAKKIIHIKAEGHYVRIFTQDSEKFIRKPFSQIVSLMDTAADGMKIHRSHWVCYGAISTVEKKDRKSFVRLNNGSCVPLSANKVDEIKQRLFDDTENFELLHS